MKIKNILIAFLMIILSTSFVACGAARNVQTKAINMGRYFSSVVSARNANYNLSSFVQNNVDSSTVGSQTYLKFKGNITWIYGMYVECAYFYFYSTRKTDAQQIKVTISNVGDTDFEKTIEIKTTENSGTLVKIDIDKTVSSLSEDFVITIALEDAQIAVGSYKWSIYGLAVYGEHR